VVYEEPLAVAVDIDSDNWITPLHGDEFGGSIAQLPGKVPVTRWGAADGRFGVEALADSARRLCQELGPVLLVQSAWNEAGKTFNASEASYVTVAGTTYTELFTGSTAAFAETAPGWSLSS